MSLRTRPQLFHDNLAEAEAMAREVAELAALTDQQIEAELAAAVAERERRLNDICERQTARDWAWHQRRQWLLDTGRIEE